MKKTIALRRGFLIREDRVLSAWSAETGICLGINDSSWNRARFWSNCDLTPLEWRDIMFVQVASWPECMHQQLKVLIKRICSTSILELSQITRIQHQPRLISLSEYRTSRNPRNRQSYDRSSLLLWLAGLGWLFAIRSECSDAPHNGVHMITRQ